MDTYKEIRVIEFPGMTVKVYIPDLTPEERAKRLQAIYDQAAVLLFGKR